MYCFKNFVRVCVIYYVFTKYNGSIYTAKTGVIGLVMDDSDIIDIILSSFQAQVICRALCAEAYIQ